MQFLPKNTFVLLKTAWDGLNSIVRFNVAKKRAYRRSFYLNYFKFIKGSKQYNKGFLNPIDVFIPVIERDFDTLLLTVPSLRLFSNNPIKNIYLVAPHSAIIKEYAEKNNCQFIDETSIISKTENLEYIIGGVDRSNWLYQQLLKLSWDKVSKNDYCLIFDADTVLLKNHSFVSDGKISFNISDEYHNPYFITYNKLLNIQPKLPISFIGHYMVFERETTNALKKIIEKTSDLSWIKAIIKHTDFNEPSGFSEYETYGHYMNQFFKSKTRITFQENILLKRDALEELSTLVNKYSDDYLTISFHYWYN